jgi:hypothetical protein
LVKVLPRVKFRPDTATPAGPGIRPLDDGGGPPYVFDPAVAGPGKHTITCVESGNELASMDVLVVQTPEPKFKATARRAEATVVEISVTNETEGEGYAYEWNGQYKDGPPPALLSRDELPELLKFPNVPDGISTVTVCLLATNTVADLPCRQVFCKRDIPVGAVPDDDPFLVDLTRDIGVLGRLVRHTDFEGTLESPNNPVYRDTINLLNTTKSDMEVAETRAGYKRGRENGRIAETFGELQGMTLEKITGFPPSPAVRRKRQFVYTIFLIQAKWLLKLIIMQERDLARNSLLFKTLDQTINMAGSLIELGVNLDPDRALRTLVNESASEISDKPIVASALERLTPLIS